MSQNFARCCGFVGKVGSYPTNGIQAKFGRFLESLAERGKRYKSTGIRQLILLAAGYVFVKGKRGNFSQTHA